MAWMKTETANLPWWARSACWSARALGAFWVVMIPLYLWQRFNDTAHTRDPKATAVGVRQRIVTFNLRSIGILILSFIRWHESDQIGSGNCFACSANRQRVACKRSTTTALTRFINSKPSS